MDANERYITKEEVLVELKNRGIKEARVRFSGGNDSGSVEYIDFLMHDDTCKEVAEMPMYYESWCNGVTTYYRYGKGKGYEPIEEREVYVPTAEEKLLDTLTRPVYDRYGSFAGEYDVSGMVVWTVDPPGVTFKVEESTIEYREFDADDKGAW
jgi:hypothetical protein